ncbi:pyridoxamine 5'-phosphate oxidase family protein [Enterococcus faecium]|uniref:pyridoxamine 5'-phosphate oxidase family protein n=1 Tax=Enterococcus faecium TaxID=1352 RepID=UPI000A337178|nr:pyridoxamine 5'-phosphate oxidase family protein [Enterococcus faecium]OTN91571.1 hypothetical protein A5809_000936 [Enterococcus faecium]
MNAKKEFQAMMAEQTELALATVGGDGSPNVRIVNYYFNPENNIVYFATFKNNDKVKELEEDSAVAFTTIPKRENEHIKARGTAVKSQQTIFDLADYFCEKIPGYRETIEYAGKSLIVYEIHFETATVTVDLSNSKTIKL